MRFHLPDPGEGLTEAEVVAWLVAPGDTVETNQPLVEVETAKSLVELPSPAAGVVGALLVEPGTVVTVGTPLVDIGEPDREPPAGAPGAPSDVSATTAGPSSVPGADGAVLPTDEARTPMLVGYGPQPDPPLAVRAQPPRQVRADDVQPDNRVPEVGPDDRPRPHALAKPPVRKLARDSGVDLDAVAATGPGGIVTREDVLAHVARMRGRDSREDAPWLAQGVVSPDGRSTRVPVRSVRRRTAEAMVASAFTAPHVTVFHTVDVTATMRLVARLRTDPEFADTRVTPLLVAAKALLLAVRRHPEINARWDGDAIVYQHYVNLGIAASTPRGLVVPNVKDAHRLGLHDLAVALADLTAAARAGRTTTADTADGTITVTNVGVFGIDTGTPILNPGEAAILAFGAVTRRPWVHKGKVKPRDVTQLALSFDHRLVDGELGSRVLADVAAVLTDPAQGLVWS